MGGRSAKPAEPIRFGLYLGGRDRFHQARDGPIAARALQHGEVSGRGREQALLSTLNCCLVRGNPSGPRGLANRADRCA